MLACAPLRDEQVEVVSNSIEDQGVLTGYGHFFLVPSDFCYLSVMKKPSCHHEGPGVLQLELLSLVDSQLCQ